jgi:hypothetical protein
MKGDPKFCKSCGGELEPLDITYSSKFCTMDAFRINLIHVLILIFSTVFIAACINAGIFSSAAWYVAAVLLLSYLGYKFITFHMEALLTYKCTTCGAFFSEEEC